MNAKQKSLVASWIAFVVLLALGTVVEPGTMVWIMLPAVGLAMLNQDRLSRDRWKMPSPFAIYAQNPVWKVVAIAYTTTLLGAVLIHLFVSRISLFDDPPYFLFFLGLLGPMIGPLIAAQVVAYRNLGDEHDP